MKAGTAAAIQVLVTLDRMELQKLSASWLAKYGWRFGCVATGRVGANRILLCIHPTSVDEQVDALQKKLHIVPNNTVNILILIPPQIRVPERLTCTCYRRDQCSPDSTRGPLPETQAWPFKPNPPCCSRLTYQEVLPICCEISVICSPHHTSPHHGGGLSPPPTRKAPDGPRSQFGKRK
jgi:hypothetical protein